MNSEKTKREFEDACRPAIAWLNRQERPKLVIVIEPNGASLQEQLLASYGSKEYWTGEED